MVGRERTQRVCHRQLVRNVLISRRVNSNDMALAMEIKRTLLAMVMLVLFLASTLRAQSSQWRSMRNQTLIAFDWNCSRKDWFPNPSLHKTVARSIPMDDRGGPTTYGDRAFVIKLRKAGPSVYFVPTICGATGNCTWRLYTINPLRFVGEINGQYIYTYQS